MQVDMEALGDNGRRNNWVSVVASIILQLIRAEKCYDTVVIHLSCPVKGFLMVFMPC